jgi:sugar lactone lactonase YvrE
MIGNSRWLTRNTKRFAISKLWGGALLATGVAMTFGAASCGGSSGGPLPFLVGDGVWVADEIPNTESEAPQIDEFSTGQFLNGVRNIAPRKAITNGGKGNVPPFFFPKDTLFDSSGDLWVVDGGGGELNTGAALFEYNPSQLKGHNGEITPAFFLTSNGNFEFPQFGVFDASGNLWVSDSTAGAIFEFTHEQLTATPPGGDQDPNITLIDTQDENELSSPIGLIFDSSGNLWVADNENNQILRFNSSTLTNLSHGLNDVAADASIQTVSTDAGESLNQPWGLSFDGSGDLWVTNEAFPQAALSNAVVKSNVAKAPQQAQANQAGQGTVVEFAAADLPIDSAHSPTPAATILPTDVNNSVSLDDPNGISVDVKRGLVIVANEGVDESAGSISAYRLKSIGAGGALVPNSFVPGTPTTTLFTPTGLIVGPIY